MGLLRRKSCRLRALVVLLPIVVVLAVASWAQDQASPAKAESATQPAQRAATPTATQPATDQASSSDHKTSAGNDQKASPATNPADASDSEPAGALRLGPGDLVEVNVYNVPELTTKARIATNGDIYLPLIDYAHVAGLTNEEAQELIEKKLADGGYVKNPHVTIFVDEYESQGTSVLGEVVKPGVYPVMGQPKLFDLISAAGGLTDRAGNAAVITHREQPAKPITVPIARDLGGVPQSNIEIHPGDMVVVRRADVVFVVGDVARPSGLLIDRGTLTVLQAIALAGGTTRTSRLNGTRIIRKGPDGISEKHVELKKILEAKSPDVLLTADDILFVPSSSLKLALQDNASVAMQAASLGLVAVR